MTFLSRNNYYPKLYVNGRRIPDAQIDGASIVLKRSESDNTVMAIHLRPSAGLQNFALYQGLPIILDVQTGITTNRLFTGIIDIDEYDILNEYITLRCTDNRDNRIKAIPSVVNTIGYFNESIFGITDDLGEQMAKRLSTIPYSFDFDAYGNYQLVAWQPKAVADFTLTDSDVYRRTPSVKRTQRAQIINTTHINFKYSFQRLHHRETSYRWASGVSVCDFLIYGFSLCSKEMVRQASASAGWPLKAPISFTAVYPSGSYNCFTVIDGIPGVSIGWIGSSTTGVNYVNQQEVIVNGQSATTVSHDASGNAMTTSASDSYLNASYDFCIGAQWTATTRFTQNIVEDYTISITAPQSVAQYGTIETTQTYNINDKYDASSWENYKAYTNPPAGAVNLRNPAGSTIADYIIDKDTERGNTSNAIQTAMQIARTSLIKSHRQNTVTIQTDLWPEIDLKHTVALACTKISAKGKVSSISHTINIGDGADAWTEVELKLSTSIGSASDSSFAVPTKPTYVPIRSASNIGLQSHYGEDPTTTAAQKWTGHIGNRWIDKVVPGIFSASVVTNPFKTSYTESFVVDTPAIEDAARDTKTLTASQSYTISIPNDPLTITFNGKLS